MAAVYNYLPASIQRLNETYNPLSEKNIPSVAHGKYAYLWGMIYASYGEITQSSSYLLSGAQLKARGVAEMQAANLHKSASEFAEMVKQADEAVLAGSVGAAAEGVTNAGGVVVDGGRSLADGIYDGGKMLGGGVVDAGGVVGERFGEGVTSGFQGVGEAVQRGGKEGVQAVSSGVEGARRGAVNAVSGLWGRN